MTFDLTAMREAKEGVTKDRHWIYNTLMGKEFGEFVKLFSAHWSELDECAPKHADLIAMAPDMLAAAREEGARMMQEAAAGLMDADADFMRREGDMLYWMAEDDAKRIRALDPKGVTK